MLPGFAPLMVSVGIHRMSWLLRFGQEWRGERHCDGPARSGRPDRLCEVIQSLVGRILDCFVASTYALRASTYALRASVDSNPP
jgi:hypothetical protein